MMEFTSFESAVRQHKNKDYNMCNYLHLAKCVAMDIANGYGAVYMLPIGDEEQFADLISNQCYMLDEMMNNAVSNSVSSNDRIGRLNTELTNLRQSVESYKKKIDGISNLEEEKKRLENEYSGLVGQKQEYDKLVGNIEKIRIDIEKADKFDLQAKQKELNDLTTALNVKTQNNAALIAQVNELQGKLTDLDNANQEKQQKCNELQNKITTAADESKRLEAEKIRLETEKKGFDEQNKALQEVISEADGEIAVDTEKLAGFRQKMTEAKKKLAEEDKIDAENLKILTEQVAKAQTDRKNKKDTIRKLQREKNALKKLVPKLDVKEQSLMGSSEVYSKKLKEFSEILEETKKELTSDSANLISTVNALSGEIENLKIGNEQAEKRQQQLQKEKEGLTNISDSLAKMNDGLKTSVNSLADIIKEFNDDVSKENEKLSEENAILVSGISELVKKNSNLKSEVEYKKGEKNNAEVINEELGIEYDTICWQLKNLKSDYEEWKKKFGELDCKKDTVKNDADDDLRKKYTDLSAEYNQFYNEKLKPQLEKINEINIRIDDKNLEYEKQVDENKRLNEDFRKISNKIENYNTENQKLEERITVKKAELQPIEKRYFELSEQYNELNTKYGNIDQRNRKLENEVIPEIKQLLVDVNGILTNNENSIKKKAESLCGLLETQYSEINQEMIILNGQLKQMEDNLKNVEKEYNEKTNDISSYDKQIRDLQNAVKLLEDQNESEKREGVKKQLETQKRGLEDEIKNREIQIDDLKVKLKKSTLDLSDKNKELEALQKQKNNLSTQEKELAREMDLLRIYSSDEYQKKLEEIEKKLSNLVAVKEKVQKMLGFVSEITGKNYNKNGDKSHGIRYSEAFGDILKAIPEMQEELSKTANSVLENLTLREVLR